MDGVSLLVLTGPPGAGKTTVGRLIAAKSPTSACIHSDWFWTTIVNGRIPPWERAANAQNGAMIRSATAAAVRIANAGFTTVLDGIIGPWFFDAVSEELEYCRVPVDYAVLRPDVETSIARAQRRVLESEEHRDALADEGPIRHMWNQFSDLGPFEPHVIDTSDVGPEETALLIHRRIADGHLRFPAGACKSCT